MATPAQQPKKRRRVVAPGTGAASGMALGEGAPKLAALENAPGPKAAPGDKPGPNDSRLLEDVPPHWGGGRKLRG